MTAMKNDVESNINYQNMLDEKKHSYVYTDQSLLEKILYPVPTQAQEKIQKFIDEGKRGNNL